MNCQSFTQSVKSQIFLSIDQIQSLLFDSDMQVPFGAESEEELTRFADSLINYPEENNYGETVDNHFNSHNLGDSSNRLYLDGPVISGRDTEGVNERVNQYRSLAISDN